MANPLDNRFTNTTVIDSSIKGNGDIVVEVLRKTIRDDEEAKTVDKVAAKKVALAEHGLPLFLATRPARFSDTEAVVQESEVVNRRQPAGNEKLDTFNDFRIEVAILNLN